MAVLMPVILLVLLGIAQFGWLLVNYIVVGNAASSAARTFASQRGTTTPSFY
jgi:Flp pilus assembly protein TadG